MFKFLQKLFGFDTPAPPSDPDDELESLEERNRQLSLRISELTKDRIEVREKIDGIWAKKDADRGRI